jgi:hypothetical protein
MPVGVDSGGGALIYSAVMALREPASLRANVALLRCDPVTISALSGDIVELGLIMIRAIPVRFIELVRSFATTFSAAQAVSAAVEAHRQPSAASLKILGIDPEQFRTIRFV